MDKVKLGEQKLNFPMPVVLVGAIVQGKPNFMTVAWCGVVNSEPPMVSVAIRRQRHTYGGIRENGVFSVNVPSVDIVKEADYCGIVSGRNTDKASACGFTVFYGNLKSAPLIGECPVNIECKVLQTIELPSHVLFIGSVEEVHAAASCLTNGTLDFTKIRPFIYSNITVPQYQSLGDALGKQYANGKDLKIKI
jgi:flavin reductase (DIM6/NTAB) family NADH-FMN oxidoreductase RutF